jgi:hypothetical protein
MAFGQTAFGRMVFQSNGLSVKWPFGKMVFGQMACGQPTFRSKGVRSKKIGEMIFRLSDSEPSVKCCFEQSTFGQKLSVRCFFGKMNQNHKYMPLRKNIISSGHPSLP